jgi:DNA-binding NarL/FixJ family response regulator
MQRSVKGPKPRPIELTEDERATLTTLARRPKTALAMAQRARIVLAAADGLGNTEIARRFGVGVSTAVKWRPRFLESGSCHGRTLLVPPHPLGVCYVEDGVAGGVIER